MDILSINSKKSRKQFILERNSQFVLTELCRLCGNASGELLSICESGHKNELGRKIEKHLPVQISENDYLPQQVCYNCANTVLAWHDLTEKVLKIKEKFDEILREMSQVEMDSRNENKVAQPAAAAAPAAAPAPALDPAPAVCLCIETHKSSLHSMNSIGEKLVSVSHENVRSQEQDCQAISVNKTGDIVKSSLKLFESQDVKVVRNKNHVISQDSNGKEKYCSLYIDKQSNESCFTEFPLQEPAKTINNMSSIFTCPDDDSVKDSRAAVSIRSEVLCVLTKNSFETRKFHMKSDHDYVLPEDAAVSADSRLETPNDKSLQYNMCVEQQSCTQSYVGSFKQFSYRLKYVQNSTHFLHIIVQRKRVFHGQECEICKQVFQNVAVLVTHSRFHAKWMPFFCKFCGKGFFLSGSLKTHHKKCLDKRTKLSKETIMEHLRMGSDNMYPCDFCERKYKLKTSLKEHLLHHIGKARRKLKCEICHEKFLRKADILDHMKSHDVSDYLSCDMCNKILLNEKDLHDHQITHSDDRPFICDICALSYKRKSHLTRHLLIHSSNPERKHLPRERFSPGQEYKCDHCGKVSRTKHLLALHMISHTGERNYECNTCGKRFGQSGALSRHIHTVHIGAKDFTCELCNRSFTAKATKENHMRIHTGEKPFQCSQCGKTFRTQHQHKLHEKSHSDVRPYSCQYCSKKFKRRPHLVMHIRTHTGEKPFACSICGKSFAQKNDMTKHVRIHRNGY